MLSQTGIAAIEAVIPALEKGDYYENDLQGLNEVVKPLIEANIYFYYADSFDIDGSAFLFLGYSGAGKTSTVLKLKEHFAQGRVDHDDAIIYLDSEGPKLVRDQKTPYSNLSDNLRSLVAENGELVPIRSIFYMESEDESRSLNCIEQIRLDDIEEILCIRISGFPEDEIATAKKFILDALSSCPVYRVGWYADESERLRDVVDWYDVIQKTFSNQ